jgi:hypothetical protein
MKYEKGPAVARTGLQSTISVAVLFLASCAGGGSSVSPSVTAPPTGLSYAQPPAFSVGQAISPLTPTVTGTVTAYAVSPALPSGLSLNTSSGVISGTPTAVAAQASHTVTASNSGGSTTATVAITVNVAAPVIAYSTSIYTLTTGVPAQGPTPTNSGGAAATWSISPTTLPTGLTLSATTGSISGTPTVAVAPATYTVTAGNSGGMSTASLRLGVQTVLLDLGQSEVIETLRLTSSRVLSVALLTPVPNTRTWNWLLWDYAVGAKLARGTAACWSSACMNPTADMEGPTMVVETASGLEVRSSTDGTLLSVLSAPVTWWKLASDGSYICTGSTTALTAWSLSGSVITTRSGDYSAALAYAAPGQVQVALGPAGANVVETVALSSGTSSVSSPFQGQFNAWFIDGQQFLTNVSNTVWVYTSAGVQTDFRSLASANALGGRGSWFWNQQSGQLNIYKVGNSSSPAASYPIGSGNVAPSGSTIGVFSSTTNNTPSTTSLTVIDLSGSTVAAKGYSAPVQNAGSYAAVSASQWVLANQMGVLLDGASLGGTPRYFGYGQAMSIAGSSIRVAVATASGSILYFNAPPGALEGTINFPASQLALSSDGTVLAASSGNQTLNVYSLPSGALIDSWFYAACASGACLFDFALSASGTALGQVTGTFNPTTGWACTRQVTALTGGPVLWSDRLSGGFAGCDGLPIRLSPDGTEVAVSNGRNAVSGTNIYKNGTLLTTVPGWVVGWLDNSRIFVDIYTAPYNDFAGNAIYSTSGVKMAALAMPEFNSFDVVSPDLIYDPQSNGIYSTVTGVVTWETATPILPTPPVNAGAIAGSNVVFATGNVVVSQPY